MLTLFHSLSTVRVSQVGASISKSLRPHIRRLSPTISPARIPPAPSKGYSYLFSRLQASSHLSPWKNSVLISVVSNSLTTFTLQSPGSAYARAHLSTFVFGGCSHSTSVSGFRMGAGAGTGTSFLEGFWSSGGEIARKGDWVASCRSREGVEAWRRRKTEGNAFWPVGLSVTMVYGLWRDARKDVVQVDSGMNTFQLMGGEGLWT